MVYVFGVVGWGYRLVWILGDSIGGQEVDRQEIFEKSLGLDMDQIMKILKCF